MNPIKEAILARLRRRRASVCDPAHEVEPADDSAQDTPPAAAAAPSPAPHSETRPAAPQSAPVTVAPAMPVPRPDTPASATAIADACSKAGEPSLITSFIQRRATLAEVDARLDDIWRMRDVARRATNIAEGDRKSVV